MELVTRFLSISNVFGLYSCLFRSLPFVVERKSLTCFPVSLFHRLDRCRIVCGLRRIRKRVAYSLDALGRFMLKRSVLAVDVAHTPKVRALLWSQSHYQASLGHLGANQYCPSLSSPQKWTPFSERTTALLCKLVQHYVSDGIAYPPGV